MGGDIACAGIRLYFGEPRFDCGRKYNGGKEE